MNDRWKFCPQCAAKLPETWKFCAECGQQIGASVPIEISVPRVEYIPLPYPVHPPAWPGYAKVTTTTTSSPLPPGSIVITCDATNHTDLGNWSIGN